MAASHGATRPQYRVLSVSGMNSVSSVVVIGHGMVGHRFVEALRARDTEEVTAAYNRVGLVYPTRVEPGGEVQVGR